MRIELNDIDGSKIVTTSNLIKKVYSDDEGRTIIIDKNRMSFMCKESVEEVKKKIGTK